VRASPLSHPAKRGGGCISTSAYYSLNQGGGEKGGGRGREYLRTLSHTLCVRKSLRGWLYSGLAGKRKRETTVLGTIKCQLPICHKGEGVFVVVVLVDREKGEGKESRALPPYYGYAPGGKKGTVPTLNTDIPPINAPRVERKKRGSRDRLT